MKLDDAELIQVVWDEINAQTPEVREAEYHKIEKEQNEIVKFIHEELEGLDAAFSDHALRWLYFCFQVVLGTLKKAGGKKLKLPKVKLDELHEAIEANESKINFDHIDEYCETSDNVLVVHMVDLISHMEPKTLRKTSDATAEEEEFEELESFDPAEYADYEVDDDEGDEDYQMFREMYDAHDSESDSEGILSEDEEIKYTFFLIFKSVIDVMLVKLAAG